MVTDSKNDRSLGVVTVTLGISGPGAEFFFSLALGDIPHCPVSILGWPCLCSAASSCTEAGTDVFHTNLISAACRTYIHGFPVLVTFSGVDYFSAQTRSVSFRQPAPAPDRDSVYLSLSRAGVGCLVGAGVFHIPVCNLYGNSLFATWWWS